MQNRAIILAAGRGSRMGRETANKPKCFNRLAGKRLLDWQIKSLNAVNIHDILIVRGYKGEMFDGHIKKVDNPKWQETNMVYSLFCANAFNGNTIVSYSDIVYKKDHVEHLLNYKADIVITADCQWKDLWSIRFENPLDDAETFNYEGQVLKEIGEKADDINQIHAQYMGLIKITQIGWEVMHSFYNTLPQERKDRIDMTSFLNMLVANGVRVEIVFVNGGWCEVDEYSDIIAYEKELKNNSSWQHDWR